MCDVTFHDLRHDFSHRAREAGWTTEEVAYYVGHVTKKGPLAMGNRPLQAGLARGRPWGIILGFLGS